VDPIWAVAAEMWWVAPIVAGGGAAGFFAVRRRNTLSGRRLGYDAAQHELREARREAKDAADAARVARAESARASAERAMSKDAAPLAFARRAHKDAQRASRAAVARVKASRVRVSTERAALSGRGQLPLARIRSQHDAVLARWIEYETDAAKALAFPDMSDGRKPATAAFLAALGQARDLRPAADARIAPAEFSAYRRAVDDLARTFDVAERSAHGEKVEQPDLPEALWDAARTFMDRSSKMVERTGDLFNDWNAKRRRER